MSSHSTSLSYFDLLGLPESVSPDRAALEQAYQAQQARWHPDQYAAADPDTRAQAVRQSGLLNDAYQVLRHPVLRAAHLLGLRGIDTGRLEQKELAPEFLLAQMQWREELEESRANADEGALVRLGKQTEAEFDASWGRFASCFASGDLARAKVEFHKLQFLSRLQDEISDAEAALFDD